MGVALGALGWWTTQTQWETYNLIIYSVVSVLSVNHRHNLCRLINTGCETEKWRKLSSVTDGICVCVCMSDFPTPAINHKAIVQEGNWQIYNTTETMGNYLEAFEAGSKVSIVKCCN